MNSPTRSTAFARGALCAPRRGEEAPVPRRLRLLLAAVCTGWGVFIMSTTRSAFATDGGVGARPLGALPVFNKTKVKWKGWGRKITLVLAVRRADQEGYPRLPGLMGTLSRYLAAEMVHRQLVVAPDADADAIRAHPALARAPWPLEIVPDSSLLSQSVDHLEGLLPASERAAAGGRGASYRAQMLLKLAVARRVTTAFYLVLDADVLCTRKTGLRDIIVGGRGIYQAEELGTNTRHRREWWDAADALLDAKGCVTSQPQQRVIGVTPALLSTEVSLSLIRRLNASAGGGGGGWDVSLFHELRERGRDWTEYTLYWTHACVSGLAKTRHVPSPRKLKLYDGDSGFEWNSWREWSATRAFADESFVFSVLQSISGVDPAWVSQQIAPFVD